MINSSVAAGLALLLVINILSKQEIMNTRSKIHISLTIGLFLWLYANIQWIIYEGNEIVPMYHLLPIFWLSVYPFLGYSLYLAFKKSYKISK